MPETGVTEHQVNEALETRGGHQLGEPGAAVRPAGSHRRPAKRRRSQPGRPCSCGRRWAVRPRTTGLVEPGVPLAAGAGVTTAGLVSLMLRRHELRGTSVLADHLGEAITWGV